MTPSPSPSAGSKLTLWYEQPAREAITEGLPLGNGQLGALLLGGTACERLVLNEATLWAAGPYNPVNPEAQAALPEVQRLIFAGEYPAAAALTGQGLMGRPVMQPQYQALGDLFIEFSGHELASAYRRELDLDTATVRTEYRVGDVLFTREAFISAADHLLVLRITASQPGALNCSLRLESEQRGLADWQHTAERWYTRSDLGLRGRNRASRGIDGALRFEFAGKLRTEGGWVMPGETIVNVRRAQSLTLLAAAATSYLNWQDTSGDPAAVVRARLDAAAELSFEMLRERHLADYQPLFRRLHIELGAASNAKLEAEQRPTDARIAAFEQGKDPALAALYVQYARYLLLACSRPGSQPANLQGLWNDKLEPPWGSKCTININTEMNYWPAESAALTECTEPLLALLSDLAISGQRTAQAHYNARGWVAHHNIDLWRGTAPVDGPEWGQWPMGGAWLCLHLWDHYRFTLDRAYLVKAYPILKSAAEFFIDTLVTHPTLGYRVTCPSLSPENQHPFGSALCAGPTMDNAILRDLFSATAEMARLLETDGPFQVELLALREQLPPYRVGKAGQLQEWLEDWDMDVPEPHHRHVSHLFGLHPSQQISPLTTPELAKAARRTLELRGDAATGWSLAWKVNFWARLLEGERAYDLLKLLLSPERSYTNLFDAHPPFQIDGNFGGAAGILEMIVQSDLGRLHLLPALPQAWSEGTLHGVKARGALTVNLSWQAHQLTSATLTSAVEQTLSVQIATAPPRDVMLRAGVAFELVG